MRGFLREKFVNWVGSAGGLRRLNIGAEGRGRSSSPSVRWIEDAEVIEHEVADCDLKIPLGDDLRPGQLQYEQRAAELGLALSKRVPGPVPGALPWYRTNDDAAEAERLIREALEPIRSVVTLKPPLKGEPAARGFVAWLRDRGEFGPHTNDDLIRLYSAHCAAIGHEETPHNVLRPAMTRITSLGVLKWQEDKRAGTKGNKGSRNFLWGLQKIQPTKIAA